MSHDDPLLDGEFSHLGISFRYPEAWQAQLEQRDDEWSVNVQSAGTLFWTLTVWPERPTTEEVLAAAITAFDEEYPEADLDQFTGRLGDQPVPGYDLDFVCLDLIASVRLLACRTSRQTVLVMTQGLDHEWEELDLIIAAINRSLVLPGTAEDLPATGIHNFAADKLRADFDDSDDDESDDDDTNDTDDDEQR